MFYGKREQPLDRRLDIQPRYLDAYMNIVLIMFVDEVFHDANGSPVEVTILFFLPHLTQFDVTELFKLVKGVCIEVYWVIVRVLELNGLIVLRLPFLLDDTSSFMSLDDKGDIRYTVQSTLDLCSEVGQGNR